MSITVIDVIKRMDLEPTPDLTWSVGAQVRELYEAETGEEPPKELRRKTGGGGSHCFAVYPASWRRKIEEVVRQRVALAARQPDMFGG